MCCFLFECKQRRFNVNTSIIFGLCGFNPVQYLRIVGLRGRLEQLSVYMGLLSPMAIRSATGRRGLVAFDRMH